LRGAFCLDRGEEREKSLEAGQRKKKQGQFIPARLKSLIRKTRWMTRGKPNWRRQRREGFLRGILKQTCSWERVKGYKEKLSAYRGKGKR